MTFLKFGFGQKVSLAATLAVLGVIVVGVNTADARYTGSGPACVTGVASNDRLNIRSAPTVGSRIVGTFGHRQCGFNIEAVEGNWTYVRGSSRGRNVQGWVNNRFLRARSAAPAPGGGGGLSCVFRSILLSTSIQ